VETLFYVDFLSPRVFQELLKKLPVATARCAENLFRMAVLDNVSRDVVGRLLEDWCIAFVKCGEMHFALRHLTGSPNAAASTAKERISPEAAAQNFVLLPLRIINVTEVTGTSVKYFVESMKQQGLYVPRAPNFKGIDFCVLLDGAGGAQREAWCFQVTVASRHPLLPKVFEEFANAFKARGILMFMVWVGYDKFGVSEAQQLSTTSTPPTPAQTLEWAMVPQLRLTMPYAFATYTNEPRQGEKPFRVALHNDESGELTGDDVTLRAALHLVRYNPPRHP